jgi:hypothetical protein
MKKIIQAHGKLEDFQPTTLDQIWGDTGFSKFGTVSEEEYIKHLKDLNKSDLQTHAAKIGIVPVDNREMLTKKLIKEFRLHVAAFRRPKTKTVAPKHFSKEALKILAEGR